MNTIYNYLNNKSKPSCSRCCRCSYCYQVLLAAAISASASQVPLQGGACSRGHKLALDQGAKGQKSREDWALVSVRGSGGLQSEVIFVLITKPNQTPPGDPEALHRRGELRAAGARARERAHRSSPGRTRCGTRGLPSLSQSSGQIATARAEFSSLLLFPLPRGSEAILFFPLCLSQQPAKAVGILPLTSTGFGSASFCRGGNIIVSSKRLCNSCGVRGV